MTQYTALVCFVLLLSSSHVAAWKGCDVACSNVGELLKARTELFALKKTADTSAALVLRAIEESGKAKTDLKKAIESAEHAVEVSESAKQVLEESKTRETGSFAIFIKYRSAEDIRATEKAQKDADNHEKNAESKTEDVRAHQKVLDSKKEATRILQEAKAKNEALLKFATQQEMKECVRACEEARNTVAETFGDLTNAKLSAQVGLQLGYASVVVASPKRKLKQAREL